MVVDLFFSPSTSTGIVLPALCRTSILLPPAEKFTVVMSRTSVLHFQFWTVTIGSWRSPLKADPQSF